MKPQMFIGSSVEGLRIARAIQNNLAHEVDSTLWSQGVFGVGETAMTALVTQAQKADFATFVLAPDDVAKIRTKDVKVSRDNVVLELGLFAGILGSQRVFFVAPQDPDFHVPSDLLGITPATYNEGSHDGNFVAALGTASNLILESINKLTRPSREYTNLNGKWRGVWHCTRPSYPPRNEFVATITHIGDSVRSTFESNGETYPLRGKIHRGNLITGIWGSPDSGAAYFGPFQLVISPNGKRLKGRWSGFTQDNLVESDIFEWDRDR
jgi:Predicted nucleotide-binding protein containing TIR-like domain